MNKEENGAFIDFIQTMAHTVCSRNVERNDGPAVWREHWHNGATTLFDLIWLKVKRLESYAARHFDAYERVGILDTLVDLACYAGFLTVYLLLYHWTGKQQPRPLIMDKPHIVPCAQPDAAPDEDPHASGVGC